MAGCCSGGERVGLGDPVCFILVLGLRRCKLGAAQGGVSYDSPNVMHTRVYADLTRTREGKTEQADWLFVDQRHVGGMAGSDVPRGEGVEEGAPDSSGSGTCKLELAQDQCDWAPVSRSSST